ncbi:MAG: Crp/Fnr family transcriptional regulator [Bacteroidota bacterium]
MQKLRTAMEFGGILSQDHIEYALSHYHHRHLKPNDEFLAYGKISKELGFVEQGILRLYTFGKDGEEVTKYFIRSNQFAVDLDSFYSNAPGDTVFQAVVPTDMYIISRTDWNRIIEEVPKLFILSKSLSEAALLNKIKDNDFLNFGTAQDKYEEFLRRYPDLALHVPQQYIASYLKITPQSLSRIRRQISS